MTNKELLCAIRAGDPDNSRLMELWNQNAGMISKAYRKYSGYIEPEDALQECFIAFQHAVKEYDPSREKGFAGYLYDRCRWHLSRYVENCGLMIRIPTYQRSIMSKYTRFIRSWYQVHGDLPDDMAICEKLQIDPDQLEQLRHDVMALDVGSIDTPVSGDTEGITVADTVQGAADVEAVSVERVHDQERRRAVWDAVETLNPKDRQALRLCYGCGMTYKQAGEIMSVTPSMIQQRVNHGLRQLRTGKNKRILEEFAENDRIYSKALKGVGVQTFEKTWTSSTESIALWNIEQKQKQELDRQAACLRAMLRETSIIRKAMPSANAE